MGETIFYAELGDLPQDIQDKARAIDGEEYNSTCFGICLCYDLKTKAVEIVTETSLSTGEKCNVYYVDDNGDKAWFAVELPEGFADQLFDACMRISAGRDTIQGYEVKDFVLFENRRGVVLTENPHARRPYATWMFTQEKDGRRLYEHGNYFQDGNMARADFKARANEYQRRFAVREIKLPIAEQLKQAQNKHFCGPCGRKNSKCEHTCPACRNRAPRKSPVFPAFALSRFFVWFGSEKVK